LNRTSGELREQREDEEEPSRISTTIRTASIAFGIQDTITIRKEE